MWQPEEGSEYHAEGKNWPFLSDLDQLVSFEHVPGMLAFLDLERELSEQLGVTVDLVMREALGARITGPVLAEAEPL